MAGGDAHVGREQGDPGHDACLVEAVEGGRGGQPGVGRELEDLDLGVVLGEQHLTAVVAVEVGKERGREAVHVVLDREPVIRQVVPRLPEREVALVLPEAEGDGSASIPDQIGEGEEEG